MTMARKPGRRSQWWSDFAFDHPRTAQLLRELRAFLPPLNFITVHYAYFIILVLVTSVIFWGSSDPAFRIGYADSLFLTVSAMTEAGLNTVNLSQMTTWQQVLLFLLILSGSAIWVSIWTVVFRLRAFEQRFQVIVQSEREKRERSRRMGSSYNLTIPFFRTVTMHKAKTEPAGDPIMTGMGSKTRARSLDMPNAHSSDRPSTSVPHLPATLKDTEGEDSQETPPSPANARITFADEPPMLGHREAQRTTSAYTNDVRLRKRNVDAVDDRERDETAQTLPLHSFLTNKSVGRNGQFYDLTHEEREQLGGCEYRALKVLAVVVPLYFALWQLLGCVSLGAWIAYNKPETATSNGLNPWWTGVFFGVSAFNNSGMALLDANVIPFQNSYFVLIVMGAMILAGNTAYPILLRFIFWSILKVLSRVTDDEVLVDLKDTLRFILKYPRRVYTNMFPARQTWWLLFMVCLLNVIDWVGFELFNLGNPVIEAIPIGSRVIDGLFQGLAVRSGGFYIVAISNVYIGLQILYVIMMYISVYPVVITMRHSNVYEERSLGIYEDDQELDMEEGRGMLNGHNGLQRQGTNNTNYTSASRRGLAKMSTAARLSSGIKRHLAWHGVGVAPREETAAESRVSFISHQIHGQLAHDIWWLVLAVLVISTIETSHFLGDPITYSVFNIIFEVVSAYGTVGISIGLPTQAYSFSGGWHTASKLVLCLVMLRGRHRGLPVALDRAVRLPGEQLHRDEEEDHRIRRSMTSRRVSLDSRMQPAA